MLTLTLPIPPTVNRLYARAASSVTKTATYSAWLQEAGWRINEQRKGQKWLPRDTWYWTDIRLPQSHLGDSDNRLKALHDLLHQMGVTPDDKWLMGGTYMRCHDVEPGKIVVSARTFDTANLNQWEQIRALAERMIAADAAVGRPPATVILPVRGGIA